MEETLKILIYTYGFDPTLSRQAVDAISNKSDVTEAYNWILDQEGCALKDQGGPVYPKYDCPHIQEHVNVEAPMLPDTTFISSCTHYSELEANGEDPPSGTGGMKGYPFVDDLGNVTCPAGENWICLDCGVTRCSRYVNGHCLEHWEITKKRANVNRLGAKQCVPLTSDGETKEDESGHCIAVSLADLSVWCYECQSYIIHDKLDTIVGRLQELKFESEE